MPEPRIAFDESFPDPNPEKPSAPLLELQQETAAWRAAFVSLDEEKPEPVVALPNRWPNRKPPAPLRRGSANVATRRSGTNCDRTRPTAPVPDHRPAAG